MLWLGIVTLALLPVANSQWLFPEMRPDPYLLPLPSFVTAMNTQMKRESYSPPGHQPMYANAYPEIPFGNPRTIGGDPYADIVMEHVNEGSPISNKFAPLMDILPPSTSFIPPHSELPTTLPTTTEEITTRTETTTETTTTTSTTPTTTTTTTQTTTTSTTTISTTTHATTQSTHPTLLTMKETLEDNRITEKEETAPPPPSPNNRIEEIAREVQKLILNTRGQLNTDLIPPPERKPGVQAPGFSPHQVARQRRVREFDGTASTMEDNEQRPSVYDDNAYGYGKTTDGYEPNNNRIEKELTTTPTITTEETTTVSIPSTTQSYDNTEGTTPEEYVPIVTTDTPNSVSSIGPVEESGYEPAHVQVEQHLQDYMEQHRQMQQQRAQMVYAETGNENYSKMTAKPVVKGTEKPSGYEQPQTTVTKTPTEKSYEQTTPTEEPQPSPETTYEQSETPSPVTESTVSSTTIGNYPDITSEHTKVETNEYDVVPADTTTIPQSDDQDDSYEPAQKPTNNGHSESTTSPSHADTGDSYPIDEREEGPVITTPIPTTADEGDGTGKEIQETEDNEKDVPKQVSPSNYEESEYSESVSHGKSKSSQAQSVSYNAGEGITPPTMVPNDYESVPTSPPTPSQMPSIRPTKETRKVEQSETQRESHEEYSKETSKTRVSSHRQNENTYKSDGDSSSNLSQYGQSSKSEVATESPEVYESTVAVPMHSQHHEGENTGNLSNEKNNSEEENNKDLEYAYPTLSPNGHKSEDSSSVPSEKEKTSSSGSRTTPENTVQKHLKHSDSSSESDSSESIESEEESDESKESENSEVANTEEKSDKTTRTPPINVDKDLEYAYPQREVKMPDDEEEQPRQNNRVIRPDTQKPSSNLPSNLPADALPTKKGDSINYNQVYYVPVRYLLSNKQGTYQKNSMKTSSHGFTPDESSTDSDYFIPTYNTPEELGYGRHSDHIREVSSEPPLPSDSQSPQLIVSQKSKTPGKQHQRIIISNLNNDKQKLIVKQDQSVLNGDQSSFAVQETKLNLSQRENNTRRRVFGRKLRKRRTNGRNVVHGQSVYYPQFIQQPFRFVSSPFN